MYQNMTFATSLNLFISNMETMVFIPRTPELHTYIINRLPDIKCFDMLMNTSIRKKTTCCFLSYCNLNLLYREGKILKMVGEMMNVKWFIFLRG